MVERKPSRDAKVLDELKETALEAALQVLSGVSLAKDAIAQSTARERDTESNGAASTEETLSDFLLLGAKLQVSQVRAALAFQRWVSDTLIRNIETSPPPRARPRESKTEECIEVRLHEPVVLDIPARVLRHEEKHKVPPDHLYVQATPVQRGPSFYVEWEPHDKQRIGFNVAPPKFRAGHYIVRIVASWNGEPSRSHSVRLVVHDAGGGPS